MFINYPEMLNLHFIEIVTIVKTDSKIIDLIFLNLGSFVAD
jgi:hypothetical protein